MTRTIKLAMAAAMALTATSAFATNGDNLMGLGAKARGMGGVGIATAFGAESGLANPALLSAVKSNEISFGGTLFMPKVDFESNAFAEAYSAATATPVMPVSSDTSKADMSMIPEVALASRINENVVVGIGMFGVAGMGTDYRDTLDGNTGVSSNGSFGMRTNLQLMRFAVPVSYSNSGFSVGVAPMLQYGSLNIAYAMPLATGGIDPQGSGVSEDFGFGYEIGVAYDAGAVGITGLTFGAKYQSAIDMTYDHTLEVTSQAFGLTGIDDHLEQPAEIGVGISYDILGSGNTIAFDYKQIRWADAKGYKDFEWDNQNVFSVGYEYTRNNWAVRLGYNFAENPIQEQAGASMMAPGEYDGAVKNFFNLAGFPAVVESHVTAGGTYSFTKMLSVDAAFVYAPEVSFSYDTSAMGQGLAYNMVLQNGGTPTDAANAAGATANSSADVKHSQTGVTVQLNYAF
ncbi:OmpP1/FadL family transporter [Sulfurimonas diazotrophicus]|uniref:Outer membrane protein transport protein n=1 Tax=Sulfurimonas diazotrophicus TaxID=3131939 RepID=A0ABZ3H7F7_9BACT